MAETKIISLKLVIDKKRNRVILAEAGKDFVDFLLEAFTLPVITVARLLKNEFTAGSLRSLYNSIENLSDSFIQPGRNKGLVLQPEFVMYKCSDSHLLPRAKHCTLKKSYRSRESSCNHVSTGLSYCYECKSMMSQEVGTEEVVNGINQASGNFDFVRESVTYVVMDDLQIKPAMSVDLFVTLLHAYNIKDLEAIEKKVINLRLDERIKLIKAALQSKTVLTDVFLSRPTKSEEPPLPQKKRVRRVGKKVSSNGSNKGNSLFLPD